MAAFLRSSMDGDNMISAKTLLMIWMHFVILINGVAAIHHEELDDMLPVLRLRGYNRFGNAIETSDLSLDFLTLDNLTLFAPTDDSLYTLDMSLPADSYISALRSHAVPRRLSVSDLILLSPSTILNTLLPNHTVSITVRGTRAVDIAVNGVPVEAPGLYYSDHVVIHGLAGSLSALSGTVNVPAMAPTAGPNHFSSLLPPSDPPIRSRLVQAPSVATYSGPVALLRPQMISQAAPYGDLPQASSGGDLPHTARSPSPQISSNVAGSFSVSSGPVIALDKFYFTLYMIFFSLLISVFLYLLLDAIVSIIIVLVR